VTDVTASTPAEEDALDAVDEQLIRQLADRPPLIKRVPEPHDLAAGKLSPSVNGTC
jgi:hypothetical protein